MRLNFSFSALQHCFGILLGLVALSLLSADYVSASWSCAVCQNGFNIYGTNIQMHTAASVSACAALANTYFQQNYVSSAAAANLTFVYGHYPGSLASNNCVYPVTCTGGLQYTSCNVVNNNVISPNSVARENGAALTMPTPSTGSFSQCNFMYANLIDPYINNFDSFPDLQECWGYCNDNVGSGCVAATATAQPAGGYSCALYRSNIWDQTVLGFGGFFTMIASGLTCPAPAPISNTFHQAQLYGQLYVLGQIPQCVTCSNGFNWNSASLNIQQFSTFDQCAGYAQEQFTTPYYNPFEPSGNTYIFSYGSYPGKTGSNWCAVGVQGCSESLSSSCAATTPYSGAPASANVQLYLLITYPFCPYSLVSCVNSAGTVLQGYCMNPVNGQMYSTFNGGLPTLPANPPLYYRGPTDTSTCASWQGVGGVWAGTAVEPSFPILPHAARGFQLSQNACPTPYQTCIYSNGLAVGYCWNSQYDTYWSTFCDPGTDNSNLCPGGLSTGAIGYVGPLGMTVWNRPRSTQCTGWNTQPCPAGMQTALLTGNTQQTVGLCLNPADNNIYSTYCVAATDNGCHGTFSGTQVSVINGVPMWFRQSNNPQPSWLSSWVATNYDLYSTAAGCGPLANCNSGCPSGYTQSLIVDLCIPSS